MTPDVARLIEFYKSPLGKISRALVREEIVRLAGNVRGLRVLGLGFATPYMRFTLDKAERVLAFMPARQGSSASSSVSGLPPRRFLRQWRCFGAGL